MKLSLSPSDHDRFIEAAALSGTTLRRFIIDAARERAALVLGAPRLIVPARDLQKPEAK